MITCLDENLHRKLKKLRVHGQDETYYHSLVGGNFRLDEIQAAVLRVKLGRLEEWTEKRRANAALYRRLFTEAGLENNPVIAPQDDPTGRHTYNQFVIRVPKRDELMRSLAADGIGTGVYYPHPLHLQTCFASLGFKKNDFPEAESACREVLALPVYPELSAAGTEAVVESIRRFYKGI
jgi:dTDP-4-amino-4,6-dideoxygalactose transaminase